MLISYIFLSISCLFSATLLTDLSISALTINYYQSISSNPFDMKNLITKDQFKELKQMANLCWNLRKLYCQILFHRAIDLRICLIILECIILLGIFWDLGQHWIFIGIMVLVCKLYHVRNRKGRVSYQLSF